MSNNLFQPTYLKQLCEEYGLKPSKKYGQNFLISKMPIEKMIMSADLKKIDTVVEIGPGFGVLTLAVSPLVKKVIAFEIERMLEPYWKKKQETENNIEMVWGNALKEFGVRSSGFGGQYKVLANLPYQITSRVLRTLLESENKPESITIMVQKEVAERICAKPGEMSVLAVSVQYYGEPKIICQVPKGSFWPEPKVDSAVVCIKTFKHKNIKTFDNLFFRVVKAGFANKRKQLWRNLSVGLNLDREKVKNVLQEVCGNEKVRAEELGVEEWKSIVSLLSSSPS